MEKVWKFCVGMTNILGYRMHELSPLCTYIHVHNIYVSKSCYHIWSFLFVRVSKSVVSSYAITRLHHHLIWLYYTFYIPRLCVCIRFLFSLNFVYLSLYPSEKPRTEPVSLFTSFYLTSHCNVTKEHVELKTSSNSAKMHVPFPQNAGMLMEKSSYSVAYYLDVIECVL